MLTPCTFQTICAGLPGLVALNPNDLANLSSSAGISAALQGVPTLTAAASNPLAVAAAQQLHPAAAAAAALQLQGQLGQLSRLSAPVHTQPTSGTSLSDGEVDKNDQRKARRCAMLYSADCATVHASYCMDTTSGGIQT